MFWNRLSWHSPVTNTWFHCWHSIYFRLWFRLCNCRYFIFTCLFSWSYCCWKYRSQIWVSQEWPEIWHYLTGSKFSALDSRVNVIHAYKSNIENDVILIIQKIIPGKLKNLRFLRRDRYTWNKSEFILILDSSHWIWVWAQSQFCMCHVWLCSAAFMMEK